MEGTIFQGNADRKGQGAMGSALGLGNLRFWAGCGVVSCNKGLRTLRLWVFPFSLYPPHHLRLGSLGQ